MNREEMRYKLNEVRMMINDGEHGEEQGILVDIIKELDADSAKIKKARDTLLRLRKQIGYIRNKDIEDAFAGLIEENEK